MANWSDPRIVGAPLGAAAGTQSAAYDAGLRSYMLSVYNYMASGVLLTGVVALLFARSGYAQSIMMGPGILKYVIMFAPLGFVFALSFGINRMSTAAAQATYWAYAAVMGMSLSTIFLVYTGTSIAQVFFATAGAFAGLSLWGYTTKKDLSGFGTFLIMGVVGLLVASIINIFMQSSAFSLVISFIGVLLFAFYAPFNSPEYAQAGVANSGVPATFPFTKGDQVFPDFITQHMPPTFTAILAETLSRNTGLVCAEAKTGDMLKPGHVYIAPGDFHMELRRVGTAVKTVITQGPPENSCRPAVDVLFRSVASVYGAGALGAVLTGMGQDGMRGSEHIVHGGGTVIAQDEATSVVYGMPRAVAEAGLARSILPLSSISTELVRLAAMGRRQLVNC